VFLPSATDSGAGSARSPSKLILKLSESVAPAKWNTWLSEFGPRGSRTSTNYGVALVDAH
jgi:hypothetical protein